MDIELAIDVIGDVGARVDHIVNLLGRPDDFRKLVESHDRQRRGRRRPRSASTIRTQPPMVADELRRPGRQFIENSWKSVKSMISAKAAGVRTHLSIAHYESA
jgi:hypothetical protein